MKARKKSKLRRSAEGRECQVRIAGVCNFDPATTVLAHKNGGGGGMKSPDLLASFCCSSCHDAIDGRRQTEFRPEDIEIWFYEGIFRTQEIWVSEGLVSHE